MDHTMKCLPEVRTAVADAITLKQDWLDAAHWKHLFSQYVLRCPPHSMPMTVRGIRRYLKRADVSVQEFHEMTGFSTIPKFIAANPRMPLWAFFGQLLEMKEGLTA